MSKEIYANNYEIQEDIAQGAMGMVRKALDLKLNRVVALKVVHQHLCSDDTFRKRFLREARSMAQLQHANIVMIYAVEQHEGSQFIVMEYFPGGNLSARMAPDTSLPLKDAIAITHQLASALAYAHDSGIIHRDIKPANVLINDDNLIKLTDFGIAAALDESPLTNAGQLIGTLRYMSPEQARDATLDGRSDLYSLGLMFYEMVTGSHPRRKQSNAAILSMLAAEGSAPPLAFPPDIPQGVQQIIQELVRFKPTDRIKDARALMRRLDELNLGAGPSRLANSHQQSADATMFELGSPEPLPPRPQQQQRDTQPPDNTRLRTAAALGAILLVSMFGLYKISPTLQELFKTSPIPAKETTPVVRPVTPPPNTGSDSTPPNVGNTGDKNILVANGQGTVPAGTSTPPTITSKPPVAKPPTTGTPDPIPNKGKQDALPSPPPPAVAKASVPFILPTPTKSAVVAETTPSDSDQEIRQRLEQVRALVEKKDLPALAGLTTMSTGQRETLKEIFDNYATITTSLGKISATKTTLTTTLKIDKLITADGLSMPVEEMPMIQTMPITVPRNGDRWGQITW